MHFIRKGTRKRGWNKWNYLVNSANIAGNPKNSWNYNIFEEYVLYHLESLDWQALIPDSRTDENVGQRISLEARIADTKRQLERLKKLALGTDDPPKTIVAEMNRLEAEEKNAVDELVVIEKKNSEQREIQRRIVEGAEDFKKLVRSGDRDSRLRLRDEIRARVVRFDLYGDSQSCPEANRDTALALEAMKEIGVEVIPDPTEWPRYKITFANGIEQWVFCRHAKGKKVLPGRDLSRELFFRMPAAPLVANFNRLLEGKKIVRGKAKRTTRLVPASAPSRKAKAVTGGQISSGRRRTRQTSRRTSQK
jgi:hypothetical protein